MAVSDEGRVLWRDAISLSGAKQLLTQWVGEHYVVVAALVPHEDAEALTVLAPVAGDGAAAPAADSGVLGLFVMDRQTGLLVEERYLGPLPAPIAPDTAQLLVNALAVASGNQTLIVKGNPEGE